MVEKEYYPALGRIGIAEFNTEVHKRFGENITTRTWSNIPNSIFFYINDTAIDSSTEEVAIYTNETTYGIRKKGIINEDNK